MLKTDNSTLRSAALISEDLLVRVAFWRLRRTNNRKTHIPDSRGGGSKCKYCALELSASLPCFQTVHRLGSGLHDEINKNLSVRPEEVPPIQPTR